VKIGEMKKIHLIRNSYAVAGVILNTFNTPCPIDIELTIVEIDNQVGPGYVISKNN
jgi:hypothetical protein